MTWCRRAPHHIRWADLTVRGMPTHCGLAEFRACWVKKGSSAVPGASRYAKAAAGSGQPDQAVETYDHERGLLRRGMRSMHQSIKSPPTARSLSSVCDRHQPASMQPIRLSPHHLLRRLCHRLALDGGWAKDASREFGLSHLLSQRNYFRHFLEELVSREATPVFWLLHTHSTAPQKGKCSPAVRRILGANEAFPRFQSSAARGRRH